MTSKYEEEFSILENTYDGQAKLKAMYFAVQDLKESVDVERLAMDIDIAKVVSEHPDNPNIKVTIDAAQKLLDFLGGDDV